MADCLEIQIETLKSVIAYMEKILDLYKQDYINWHERWAADQSDSNWRRRHDESERYNTYNHAVEDVRRLLNDLQESQKRIEEGDK